MPEFKVCAVRAERAGAHSQSRASQRLTSN
jgi:hypothetical protein